RVRHARPDLGRGDAELAAWSLLSALASPALHSFFEQGPEYTGALIDVLSAVLTAEYPDANRTPAPPPRRGEAGPVPAARREELLIHAVRLFARDGYAEVGLEEIGAAV